MPIFQSGGGQVGSSQITDGAIVDADVNAAAAIALTKLGGLIGNPGTFLSVETDTTGTIAVTTLANQRLIVFAKADFTAAGGGTGGGVLAYNGVTKDICNWQADSDNTPQGLSCMYTEVPGAGTQNITFTGSNAGIGNIKIIVFKLQQSA